MITLRTNEVGIVPAGALGVSFFHHLTGELSRRDGSVYFLERDGSASAAELRAAGSLSIEHRGRREDLPIAPLLKPDLLGCASGDGVPEVLLVCPNPDQLLPLLTPCVTLLERAFQSGSVDPSRIPMPQLVLCSNGIYFQRIRQVFLEKLEEATLLGRLPDLWPDWMPAIVGRLMRGVTIQTGIRDTVGGRTLYRPGPPGITRLAGGNRSDRHRVHQVLSNHGGLWDLSDTATPTRVEFDKAMVNLVANLLGQLAAIGEDGRFQMITVGEVAERLTERRIVELVSQVLAVGKAVRAYSSGETVDQVAAPVLESLRLHANHVSSSIQWLGMRLSRGEQVTDITPTELWLLDPLMHYARSAGLDSAVAYFEDLKNCLRTKVRNARLR